jgi:uncharacterized protein (DUF1499 family)
MKDKLIDIIKTGKRHQDYAYIVERTKAWRAIVSGAGLDEYMEQFMQRETDEQFKQRKRLTKQITSSVCKNVRDIEFKVPRSNSITRVVSTEASNAKDLADFNKILHEFWGDSTLDDYMDIRWIELNDTDPNSFIVLEWQPFEKDKHAVPYPFEIKSKEAIYYEYDNNKLQYVVAQIGKNYTGYWPNETIKFEQITDEEVLRKIKLGDGEETVMTSMTTGEDVTVIRIGDLYYEIYLPKPHNLGYVPAFQPGYMRDLATNGRTFLPPWWAAESVLMNLVKSKSELDLTIALHVFPQKITYAPKCQNKGCKDGELIDGSGKCGMCKGTGYVIHTSSQDAIIIPMPRDANKETVFDLSQMVYYVYPPVDLVKFMDQYVKDLSKQALQFVYNSEIYSREQVAETATGRNIDMQAVYDTLYPLVKAMAKDWEFMVNTISDITEIEVTASFTFSKDFKLKSIDGYYADLSLANTAGASPYVKGAIEDDIARIVYAEDKPALAKYFTLKAFHPFPGDTPESIALKMTQSYTPEFYKVLYSVFGFVFDELERENPGFYELNRAAQYKLLQTKITNLIPEKKEPVMFPVREPVEKVEPEEPVE